MYIGKRWPKFHCRIQLACAEWRMVREIKLSKDGKRVKLSRKARKVLVTELMVWP